MRVRGIIGIVAAVALASGSLAGGVAPARASSPSPTPSSPSPTPQAASTAPSLAEQNGAGNHVMGSQIARVEGTGTRNSRLRVMAASSGVQGIDVSSYDEDVDWSTYRTSHGVRFAWIKATEATSYTNPEFSTQYTGATDADVIRGAYHFAVPSSSSGSAQATYFSNHGGGWSNDGQTLPGALDMEWNPYSGGDCYGLSKASMAAWIEQFLATYHSRWGRYPVIYTSASWWSECVGSNTSISTNAPLWTARYASAVGALPSGWSIHTVWQYSDTGYDHDLFNGSTDRLTVFARGSESASGCGSARTVSGHRLSGAIGCLYLSDAAYLGTPTGGMVHRADGGYYQLFTKGLATYSSSTGAREIHGALYTRFTAMGAPTYAIARLGYITSGGNSVGVFTKGEIAWNPTTRSAYDVGGSIWRRYESAGGQTSFGLPKSNEVAGRGGGVRTMSWFTGGAVTWGSDNQTHSVHGAIYTRWTHDGSEKSRYGRPITEAYHSGGRIVQRFSNGWMLRYGDGAVSAVRG